MFSLVSRTRARWLGRKQTSKRLQPVMAKAENSQSSLSQLRVLVLDQPERLGAPGEEQIPKRSSSDRARDLLDAKKRNQNDKKDRPQRQESGEGAAAEDGDASRERPPVEPGFDRF